MLVTRLTTTVAATQVLSWGVLYYSFGVFTIPMEGDLGWTRTEIVGAFSLGWIVSAVAAVPVGRWIDSRGARGVLIAGSVCGPLLVVAWSRVETLAAFYLVWAGIGIVTATVLYEPVFAALVEAGESRSIPFVSLVGATAGVAAAPAASLLIRGVGWRTALVVLAGVLSLTFPLHVRFLPRTTRRSAARSSRRLAAPAVRWQAVAFLTGAVALAGAASVALNVHVVPLLVEAGHDEVFAATIAGGLALAQIPGRLLLGLLGRRCAPEAVLRWSFAFAAGAVTLLLLAHWWVVVAAFAVVFGMANGIKTPGFALVLADWFPTSYATLSGMTALVVKTVQAVAPSFASVARDAGTDYDGVVVGAAGLLVLALLATVAARRLPPGVPSSDRSTRSVAENT